IRINEDFKNLDTSMTAMDKKLIGLEVSLSKAQMLISSMSSKVEEYNSYNDKEFIAITQKRLEACVNKKHANLEAIEDEVVEKMFSLYETTKSNLHIVRNSLQGTPLYENKEPVQNSL